MMMQYKSCTVKAHRLQTVKQTPHKH